MNKIFNIYVYACIFLFTSFMSFGQIRPTAIFGDYNGYWTSQANTGYVTSRDNNNLIGFTVGGVTYATGVNNAALTSHNVSFVNENYRSFPTSFSVVSTSGTFLIGMPRFINGVEQTATNAPSLSCDTSLGFYLRDGLNGLNLGTAVFNIPKQELAFYVNVLADINPNCINDDIPDIIVTQVGQPAGADYFKFTDQNGNLVGVRQQVNFGSVTSSGAALWNFYSAGSCPHNFYTPAGFSNTTRDIRILTFKLSDFGITATNYTSAVRFIQELSGDSDVAFQPTAPILCQCIVWKMR